MINGITTEIFDNYRIKEIICKVGPDVEEIFRQFKYELGGKLPAELCYGMVAGYLRGKGFTWEEAFIGMDRYIKVMEKLSPPSENVEATFKIRGKTDGNVECELKKD